MKSRRLPELPLWEVGKLRWELIGCRLITTHWPLRRAGNDFRMIFYDLIVSMEQAAFSPRPVVGAIVVGSGLAVSFLLWLLYGHHASADFAGRWMFLPALNALLN